MKLKNKTTTQAAVNYHACTYSAVPAQCADLALIASTVSVKYSIRHILQDLVNFRSFGTATDFNHQGFLLSVSNENQPYALTVQLLLSLCHCPMMYSDSCCDPEYHFHLDTTC